MIIKNRQWRGGMMNWVSQDKRFGIATEEGESAKILVVNSWDVMASEILLAAKTIGASLQNLYHVQFPGEKPDYYTSHEIDDHWYKVTSGKEEESLVPDGDWNMYMLDLDRPADQY